MKLHEQDEQRDGLDSMLQYGSPSFRGKSRNVPRHIKLVALENSINSQLVSPGRMETLQYSPTDRRNGENLRPLATSPGADNSNGTRLGQVQSYHAQSPLAAIVVFCSKTLTITEWEVRKIRHDATDILMRMVQPTMWLLIFGQVFAQVRGIQTGGHYVDFLAPGILAQSVLFISIFAGIAIIWERDLGVIHKFLASPTPRGSIVLGKGLSSGIRAVPMMVAIYLMALLLGVKLNFNPLAVLGVLFFVALGACCFSTFSLIVASLLKTRDRVMGIGQVIVMPLFFASNAIYPINIMPGWLQVIAHINPLTYVVDGLRGLMVTQAPVSTSLGLDLIVLLAITVVLVIIGARLYPRIIQ